MARQRKNRRKKNTEKKEKKSFDNYIVLCKPIITIILGLFTALYPILNTIYKINYQSKCEKFYCIPGEYFNSNINNALLYLSCIVILVLISIMPAFMKKYFEKTEDLTKGQLAEAAVISVFYALILSVFIYKSIEIKEIFDVCVETIRTFAPILFILATSVAFSRVLTLMQVPQIVSEWILTNFSNKIIILVINLVLLAVGMVMDTTPAILILTPILLPIVTAIGVNPIQFGVIMIVNLAIGFITPPIGINLFVASSLTDVPVMDIAKKSIPMIICFLIALLLFTFIPSISLMLL